MDLSKALCTAPRYRGSACILSTERIRLRRPVIPRMKSMGFPAVCYHGFHFRKPYNQYRFVLIDRLITRWLTGDSSQLPDMSRSTYRAVIIEFSRISAVQTGIVWNIDCEIRNVMIHCIVHDGLQCLQIVLRTGIQFNISDASCRTVSGKLTFDVNLLERIDLFPYRNMDGICKELLIRNIRNDSVLFLELLHCSVAKVFCQNLNTLGFPIFIRGLEYIFIFYCANL